jgi:serine phosphatase RsbU (regulator of sigma subunit)
MIQQIKHNEIQIWSEVIYNPDNKLIQDISSNWVHYRKIFMDKLAELFYKDIQRSRHLYTAPFSFKNDFDKLSEEEKSVWYDYVLEIPKKLRSLNLFIRPYRDFCRTCLIPYNELELMAQVDHENYFKKLVSDKSVPGFKKYAEPFPAHFHDLPEKRKRFYIELNHLIPVGLKKIGFEIMRIEEISEINEKIVLKLAKAIHSRYQHEVRKQKTGQEKGFHTFGFFNPGNSGSSEFSDFEDLPEEIKHSNLDNAYHIPTKLLSIGYVISRVQKGYKPIALRLNEEETEIMAKVEHIRWCWDKILNGWIYGNVKDSRKKTHPAIIPYEDLSESEKEKDRELVRLIPALLQDIDYEVCPVNPDRIKRLSYAIKPHGGIHKILDETREINEHIRKIAKFTPPIEEKVRISNQKIEEAIKEIEGSYNYALHIQESFLPDDLYIRECFPDSFVFFKPKDIVSGDFYFFSKRDHKIIFATADCTGHGIPGALLTTIGYGILDQAVNELKLTDPVKILQHLYSRVHRFLKFDTSISGLSDDMDIILCNLDIKTNILTFSGVNTPFYHITDGKLIENKAKNLKVELNENGEYLFASDKIKLNIGDVIYLCSDGYADQFGGKSHKKYQSARFRDFLTEIHKLSMPEQSERLYHEIEHWREENNEDQTDDIVIIGIRI